MFVLQILQAPRQVHAVRTCLGEVDEACRFLRCKRCRLHHRLASSIEVRDHSARLNPTTTRDHIYQCRRLDVHLGRAAVVLRFAVPPTSPAAEAATLHHKSDVDEANEEEPSSAHS